MVLKRHGTPAARVIDAGFASLVQIILGQQVSTKAAATVFQRVQESIGSTIEPAAILVFGETRLRGCGLSGRKADYILSLASAAENGSFDIDALRSLADADVIDAVRAQRGLGRWSGEIYAMFALGRADIMPADDLAMKVGLQRLKALDDRPDAKTVREMTVDWAPYRSAGALVLWRLYGATTLSSKS